MYWAPGAAHGPHHIFKEWADKYKGKFDDGWDACASASSSGRRNSAGFRPTRSSRRATRRWPPGTASRKPSGAFQTRLMEVFAGFVEHSDAQVGKLIDGLDALGIRDNTLILYIFGDNGSSAEGQRAPSANCSRRTTSRTRSSSSSRRSTGLGGLDALGGPKTDNMYHAGWAWAGSTPFKSTKLVAPTSAAPATRWSISWPKGIKPDKTPRSQFHHVNDIAPTLYDILGIKPPKVVNGFSRTRSTA